MSMSTCAPQPYNYKRNSMWVVDGVGDIDEQRTLAVSSTPEQYTAQVVIPFQPWY